MDLLQNPYSEVYQYSSLVFILWMRFILLNFHLYHDYPPFKLVLVSEFKAVDGAWCLMNSSLYIFFTIIYESHALKM